MELFIFFKSKSSSKKKSYEYFKYQSIEHIAKKLKAGVESYSKEISNFAKKDFNPLSLEKDKKILEVLDLEKTINESKLMEIYKSVIVDNQIKNYDEEDLSINHLKKLEMAKFPVLFYAIKDGEKVYFKKSSDSRLFMENKYGILLKRDTANEFNKKELMLLEMNFDFYIDKKEIVIRNSFSFESIVNYDTVYEKHKEKIMVNIKKADIIQNFDQFQQACNKSDYYRAFRKVNEKTDFKKAFSNRTFITKLQKDTLGKIKWDEKNKKVQVGDLHIKTVLHIFNGLIGIDIHNEIVTFNEKFKLPN